MITDEQFVDLAYDVALARYYQHKYAFDILNIEKDDYLQDAVLYLFNLYKDGYFKLEKNKNVKGMLYKMLGRFSLNAIQTKAKKEKRRAASLDEEHVSEHDWGPPETKKDRVPSDDRDFGDYIKQDAENEQIAIARNIIEGILDKLDPTPYKTYKHKYTGDIENLGAFADTKGRQKETLKLSERNLAVLLLSNMGYHDVLKVYGVDTKNIGTSSRATFVQRKFKEVIKKLTEEINSLNDSDREYVKKYINDIVLGKEVSW